MLQWTADGVTGVKGRLSENVLSLVEEEFGTGSRLEPAVSHSPVTEEHLVTAQI